MGGAPAREWVAAGKPAGQGGGSAAAIPPHHACIAAAPGRRQLRPAAAALPRGEEVTRAHSRCQPHRSPQDLRRRRERESIFSSPLSSRCKLHAAMPYLLEMNFVQHSVRRDKKWLCISLLESV